MVEYALLLIFPVAMLSAGAADLVSYTIPNRIAVCLVAAFFVVALFAAAPWSEFLNHFAAGLAMLLVGFALFARGWVGGGDAKLIAAAALWLGLENLVPFLFWTAMLGGALALILLTYRRILPPLWLLRQPWAMRLHDPKEGIPYGIALAGAGLIVYPSTFWMTALAG